MNAKHTYTVKPDWRKVGIKVEAESPFWAIDKASATDARLIPFTWTVGLASQRFDWGMRFEREQTHVDVVLEKGQS